MSSTACVCEMTGKSLIYFPTPLCHKGKKNPTCSGIFRADKMRTGRWERAHVCMHIHILLFSLFLVLHGNW